MGNERLNAYYEAQTPSEACMVRLCNLEQRPRPKPLILRLALPLTAACLLILVLVTHIRPTPEGVTAPLATSTPTARETLTPEPTPAATVTPTHSPQAAETSAPQTSVGSTAPVTEGPVIPPENEGSGGNRPKPEPSDRYMGSDKPKPEPSPSDWWWLGGGGSSGSSEPPSSDPGAEDLPTPQMPEEVTDITGVYENGDLIFTDLNTGETVTIDLTDEPLEPGDSGAAGIHIFGRDLIVALSVGETAEDVTVYLFDLSELEANP